MLDIAAGKFQESVLKDFDLPLPLSDNLQYYDGNITFALTVAEAVRSMRLQNVDITDKNLCVLASTNGVNDWWMDEVRINGERNYLVVEKVWNKINYWCYQMLNYETGHLQHVPTPLDTQIDAVISYYKQVLAELPKESQCVAVQHLLAINLYQGLSLLQEHGMRKYLGLNSLTIDDINMLKRMQIEKGGMMVMYIAPLLPSDFDITSVLPSQPPSLIENYQRFCTGETIYP